MTTLHNNTGTKLVRILTDTGYAKPVYRAFYVQVYNGEEQVLDSKDYASIKMAEKWANKKLN
tara:strand:+ start:249 stop:434 length:186 start_codon:yes stop_codon:yes gene_type:complete